MNINYYLSKLTIKKNLTKEESENLLEIMEKDTSSIQIASVLTALKMKGETTDEIIGFINFLRKKMLKISAKGAIDVCGTGGDGKGTFNISTAVSFVVAGCKLKIAKHGNKAASSKSGSADVLEELGVKINILPENAEKILQRTGMVFLFAPLYHKSLKNVASVRKELGFSTVFNLLGPFVNPGNVNKQIIGVSSLEIAEKLSVVAKHLNYDKILIVTTEDGMDEASTFSKTFIFEVNKNSVKKRVIKPANFGFARSSFDEIAGGDAKENARIILDILNGKKGARRDIVVFNSALALIAAGKTENINSALKLAQESIDKGYAKRILENLIKETNKYA